MEDCNYIQSKEPAMVRFKSHILLFNFKLKFGKLSGSANNCFSERVRVSKKLKKKLKEENSRIFGD